MKALVTGAPGFIGSFLCKGLINRGIDISAFALPGEGVAHLEDEGIEIHRGDLRNPSSLKGICDNIDVVFHLAGRVTDWGSPRDFYGSIFDTTKNLLDESVGKVSRFVYISSIAACGLGRHLKGQREEDTCFKSGVPYNDAKLDTERLAWRYHEGKDIACTVVRPANVIGPNSVWVKDVIERYQKLFVPLIDQGMYSASLLYLENLVDGIILSGTLEIGKGKTYHFRDDWEVTWKEYVTELGTMVGKRPMGSVPFPLAWYGGLILEKILTPLGIRPPITRLAAAVMGRDNDVDTTKARTELGWKTLVSYEEAMDRIEKWVKDVFC